MNFQFQNSCAKILIFGLLFGLFLGCKKKKNVELDTSAIACKAVKLLGSRYTKISDGTCTGSKNGGKIRVSCKYEGAIECIKKLHVSSKFYTSASIEIPNVNSPTQFGLGDSRFIVTNDSIIFNFDYSYSGTTDPKLLSFIYLNYHIESESGDVSTKAQLRVNANCSSIDSTAYKVVKEYRFTSDTLAVTVYDADKEDGDQISLWLNDIIRLDNFVLKKMPSIFKYKLKEGKNRLIIFAITEGGEGSSTPAIKINAFGNINMLPSLTSGEAIDIYYTPK